MEPRVRFADRLCDAVKRKGTCLVVGLDPVAERLPVELRGGSQPAGGGACRIDAILEFCTQTAELVAPMVPAVKINIAFFERYLAAGIDAYFELVGRAKRFGLEVIGDVKRGDIGHTAAMYAAAHLADGDSTTGVRRYVPDAVTVNGFAGMEGILPFAEAADREGRGVFVWVRASNPTAAEIQDFAGGDGRMMHEVLADVVGRVARQPARIGDSGYSSVGMVAGGLSAEKALEFRARYDHVWFLVPGYGRQGCAAADCVKLCKADGTGALINASRSIIYAFETPSYAERFGGDWKAAVEQAVVDARADLARAAGEK